SPQRRRVISYMFEYVQANAGIEIESCELRDGFLVLRFREDGLQIWRAREAFAQAFENLICVIQCNDEVAIQKVRGEISRAAADFKHSAAELRQCQPRLPCKIVLRGGHERLIPQHVIGRGRHAVKLFRAWTYSRHSRRSIIRSASAQ